MNIKRLGFCCKWIDTPDQVNGIKATDDAKKYNTTGTTVAWLSRQSKAVAEQKLWDLMKQNIESTYQLVKRVSELNEQLRMVRISSDLLPVYTHRDWSYFWRQSDVRDYAEKTFAKIGMLARERGVRLSFHPGQFTVLASDNEDIVSRSIEEFEYHADMARWMGYGQKFQDFKINVHIAGRQGPEGIRRVLGRLSPEARNTITIENEENSWGLDDCLSISDVVPIVLDCHHHWVREGRYIQADDPLVTRVMDSWRGVRPIMHYSVSREDWLPGHDVNILPDYHTLLSEGKNKQKLRAHSDFYWNNACNEWALSFLDRFDIMSECKSKNLGAHQLFEFWKQLENSL
jgi:UV damage endonuclease UvdE